ncbi:hypothetical protein LF1_21660 [Rubripirellula obstinata]|uniref:Tetratricopeptide repeat protein n=1 Tax=Rubripirellula obstinata TaxID=406547 RepID=A0A5B1CHD7_9BACT|nr:hypothetical protein [Rubripirellula obstinata]KAA1259631.1 hypothetical protein LF1_21660 [Rubripirellula obstinata]
MKLSSLIIAGTFACGVSLNSAGVQGQSISEFGSKPTRLPAVGQRVGGSVAERTDQQDLGGRQAKSWLQSTTPMASSDKACQKLEQAKIEYHSKAWLSAEQSAWEAISLFSQAIDLRSGNDGRDRIDAGDRFRVAKDAILEARDFGSSYATTDSGSLLRLAKSHRTNLIATDDVDGLTAAVAADRYLDLARRNLAPIAARDSRCAEAIDFLAAIYLGRNESKQLPGETALCLRRAALQGQPDNADLAARLGMQLADVGLVDEAKWALEHSLQIYFQPVIANRLASLMQRSGQVAAADQWRNQVAVRSRFREGVPGDAADAVLANSRQSSTVKETPQVDVPIITQLSPSEFASVSRPVMQEVSASNALTPNSMTPSAATAATPKAVVPVSFASTRLDELNHSLHAKPARTAVMEEPETKAKNPVTRWFQSIKSPWKSDSK